MEQIKNEELRKYTDKYLGIGEYVVDQAVVLMNASSYFKRQRD